MSAIKCVAIDDEPIALSIIEEYCRRFGNLELRSFTSPIAGMECVESWRPAIVFLDIEMNSHNGVDLARKLPEGTCLIFTTAYSNYAIDGFNVDAIDFLHKPIFYSRFERAMEKALKWVSVAQPEAAAPSQLDQQAITLKVEHKTVVVRLADIVYVEAMDNYVKIHRKESPMVLTQLTMKEMETMLPSDNFIRVHRSFIVSRREIVRFSNRKISLTQARQEIPVGRKYMASFREIYNNSPE